MKISEKGLQLIKEFEGYEGKAYLCPAGVWTIGYGHTQGVEENDMCSVEEAVEFLKKDVEKAERAVNDLVKHELNQNQFDALVSFVFNLGRERFRQSSLLKFLNSAHFPLAGGQFDRWIYADGKVMQGLVKRRAAEKKLFLEPMQ